MKEVLKNECTKNKGKNGFVFIIREDFDECNKFIIVIFALTASCSPHTLLQCIWYVVCS
jgi:hypothetical protein